MEFNLELAINAGLAGLETAEVPITLRPRKGKSKLRKFRDGWRSLRMMLLYSPNKVFLWPGTLLFTIGMLTHIAVLLGLIEWDGRPAAGVTAVFATISSVVGFQILNLGLHAKIYSWSWRFDKNKQTLLKFSRLFTLEVGLILGGGLIVMGTGILGFLAIQWLEAGMVPLPHPQWASFGATLVILGFTTLFSSLFTSAMSMAGPDRGR
jgi:hypothetical protein